MSKATKLNNEIVDVYTVWFNQIKRWSKFFQFICTELEMKKKVE